MGSDHTGFTDVDASDREAQLSAYLEQMAAQFRERRMAALSDLNLADGMAVLDIGCGLGEMCVAIRETVGEHGRAVGIDASSEFIDQARCQPGAEAVEFINGSAYDLPFGDGEFDVARAERVFQHLADPARAMSEAYRVLRPGGRLSVLDANHTQFDLTSEGPVIGAIRRRLHTWVVNPRAGLLAQKWMHEAGFEAIVTRPILRTFDFATTRSMLLIDRMLDLLIEERELDRVTADAWLSEQEANPQVTGVIVAYQTLGVKPA